MTLDQKIDEIQNAIKTKTKRVYAWDYHQQYLAASCKTVTLDGLWLEFGVYRGRSITQIARHTNKIIYGFDSFEGLPEQWNGENPAGMFNIGGEVPAGSIVGDNQPDGSPTRQIEPWPENIRFIKGWFSDTLPGFLKEHKEIAAYIHIDSDIYSSCKTVLELLTDRIVPGTIIDFDEILDYPEYREHEIKAFAEFLLATGRDYEALIHQDLGCYTQAAIRIK